MAWAYWTVRADGRRLQHSSHAAHPAFRGFCRIDSAQAAEVASLELREEQPDVGGGEAVEFLLAERGLVVEPRQTLVAVERCGLEAGGSDRRESVGEEVAE